MRFPALALAAALPLPALAQTGLEPLSIETRAYDSVLVWNEREVRPMGLTETARRDGHVFLDVEATFDIPWSDDLSRISIQGRDVRLTLPDGTEIGMVGGYDYLGMMELGTPGLSVSRPSSWPDEDRDGTWSGVFIVPVGTETATLTLPGEPGWSGEIAVPAAVEREDDPAGFASFEVTDVSRARRLVLSDRMGDEEVETVLTPLSGHVLVDLEIEVTPSSGNRVSGEDRFHWSTHTFSLMGGDGVSYWPAGERFMNRIMGWQFNGANAGDSATRRVVWMVPESATQAFLFFGETMVATVDLTGDIAEEG